MYLYMDVVLPTELLYVDVRREQRTADGKIDVTMGSYEARKKSIRSCYSWSLKR